MNITIICKSSAPSHPPPWNTKNPLQIYGRTDMQGEITKMSFSPNFIKSRMLCLRSPSGATPPPSPYM